MTPDAAAALLGIPATASPAEVEAAYRRRARESHPDLFVGVTGDRAARAADDFIRITQAHDVLAGRPVSQPPPVVELLPLRPRWALIGTWALVALIAIFVSTYGVPQRFTAVDPILRYGMLFAALIAFALTGRQAWFITIVVAIGATAVMTLLFTSLGSLLGLFLLAAPVIGLVSIGREVARRRERGL